MSFEIDQPAAPLWKGHRFTVMGGSFVHDDGTTVVREWISPGDVVAVLPTDGSFFWLGRQPREVTGGHQLGLCAGRIDDGETPLDAAKRELLEEFGLEPEWWIDLGTFYSSEGITDERCTLFIASGISRWDSSRLDHAERVDVVKVPLYYLDEAIANVTNAKAKIALLHLWRREVKKDARRMYHKLDEITDAVEWMADEGDEAGPQFEWDKYR